MLNALRKEACLTGGGLEGAEPLADASSSEEAMSPPTELPTTLLHSLASPPSLESKRWLKNIEKAAKRLQERWLENVKLVQCKVQSDKQSDEHGQASYCCTGSAQASERILAM